MRIGITGATGLIGKAFVKLAAVSGHEVVAYSRAATPVPHAHSSIQLPGKASHQLPETRLDALVHLAGESLMGLWTQKKRNRIWNSRVELTTSLMDHLSQTWEPANRPAVILSASGIGYYGSRGDTELNEQSERGEGFLAELCEKWEAAANQAQSWGARVVNLRTSMVLAQEKGAYPLMNQIFRYGLGGHFGTGRQWMSWVHLEDEIMMILWALENTTVQGPLNLCAPNPELNCNFTQKLAQSLKRPARLHVPALAMRLLMGKMAREMLLCSQRAIPSKATEMGYRFAYPKLEDALTSLS